MKRVTEVAPGLGLESAELRAWIEEHWVLPVADDGDWLLSECDVARVHMIVELRRDLAIDDEAMPVVLGLIDQVHALRRQLRALSAAMLDLPEDARDAVARRLTAGRSSGEG